MYTAGCANFSLDYANTILELNNKAPQAILLVGGGSLTEGLDKSLAQAFNLPEIG